MSLSLSTIQNHYFLKINYLCGSIMNISTIKNELQNILSGKSKISHRASIQAITSHLRESLGTSEKTERNESIKSKETKHLMGYINQLAQN